MTTFETTQKPKRFYQTMAWVFVAIAFGGFIPTYWLKLMDGSFAGKPILHIHGFVVVCLGVVLCGSSQLRGQSENG
jgi:hypothetical protein